MKSGQDATNRLSWKVRKIPYISDAYQEFICDTKIVGPKSASPCKVGLKPHFRSKWCN